MLITPEKAIKLVVNDKMRTRYGFLSDFFTELRLTDKNGVISIPNQIAAGATAGACQCVVTSPMEMFKIAGQTGIPLKTIWNERFDSLYWKRLWWRFFPSTFDFSQNLIKTPSGDLKQVSQEF